MPDPSFLTTVLQGDRQYWQNWVNGMRSRKAREYAQARLDILDRVERPEPKKWFQSSNGEGNDRQS